MTGTQAYRLYRDPQRGRVAGVCAGLAEYTGVDLGVVRIGWFLGLVFFSVPVLLGYVLLWALLPVRPERVFASPEEEKLRRAVHLGPRRTLQDLRMKFRDVEHRVAALEAAVVSKEYALRREFRNID